MKRATMATLVSAGLLVAAACNTGTGPEADAYSMQPVVVVDADGNELVLVYDARSGWRIAVKAPDGRIAEFLQDGQTRITQAQSEASHGEEAPGGIEGILDGGGESGEVFSGSSGGAASFSGGSGDAAGFFAGSGGASSFSGGSSAAFGFSATLGEGVPLSCDATVLCDAILSFVCAMGAGAAEAEANCDQAAQECYRGVNSIVIPAAYEPIFCAVVDFLGCLFQNPAILNAAASDDTSALETQVQQCIQPLLDAGLEDFDLFGEGGHQ